VCESHRQEQTVYGFASPLGMDDDLGRSVD
jgi:hypothetical protein